MKNRKVVAALATGLCWLALGACSTNQTPPVPVAQSGRHLSLSVVPGPHYKFTSWWFVFPIDIYPQMACWVESANGDYLGTVWATAKGARGNWSVAPQDGRPQALPVWSHIVNHGGQGLDATSSATPTTASSRDSDIAARLPDGEYVVKLEINRSYDYNAIYIKENSNVNGQPSLIYSCQIKLGSAEAEGKFLPIGTGSVDGSDGNLRSDLTGIDTALELINSATIRYYP